jgi:hypothetical protein
MSWDTFLLCHGSCIITCSLIYELWMCQVMKSQGVAADKLQLLSGISGAFRPGVLTALMGEWVWKDHSHERFIR